MSFVDVLPESSPSSFRPFPPFASFVFASSFLSLSSIFLNQNIILPAIEVQLFPHAQRNFTLALSLNCRHPLGMSVSVGPSFHLSGLKTLKISSKASFHFLDISRCGVSSSSSRREAILCCYPVEALTGFSLINEKKRMILSCHIPSRHKFKTLMSVLRIWWYSRTISLSWCVSRFSRPVCLKMYWCCYKKLYFYNSWELNG